MTFNSNKWATSLSTSTGNGRGLDNTSAQAARRLGYTVTGASTTNKFVEVRGRNGTTLLGFYGQRRWGGFQLEFSSAAVAEEAAVELDCELAADSNGRRVAVGFSDRELAKALAFVIGEPMDKAEAPKAEVPAPVKANTAALVHALVVTEDDEIASLMAKIEEVKAKKADKAAKIEALRAELAALQADE